LFVVETDHEIVSGGKGRVVWGRNVGRRS